MHTSRKMIAGFVHFDGDEYCLPIGAFWVVTSVVVNMAYSITGGSQIKHKKWRKLAYICGETQKYYHTT